MEARELTRPCPRCGEENPREFPVCWACQSDLPAPAPHERAPEPQTPAPAVSPAPAADPVARAARRKRLVLEIALVLAIVWLPPLLGGVLHAIQPFPPLDRLGAVLGMLTSATFVALLAYLAWLDGGAGRMLGLRRPALGDLVWAAGTFVVLVLAAAATDALGRLLRLADGDQQDFLSDVGWIGPLYLLVGALLEEALFRGYLWSRFRELTGRPWLSVLAASVLFSAYHAYPPADSLAVLVDGLVLGAAFVARRSLWPVVLAHWAFNVFVAG